MSYALLYHMLSIKDQHKLSWHLVKCLVPLPVSSRLEMSTAVILLYHSHSLLLHIQDKVQCSGTCWMWTTFQTDWQSILYFETCWMWTTFHPFFILEPVECEQPFKQTDNPVFILKPVECETPFKQNEHPYLEFLGHIQVVYIHNIHS